MPNVESYQAPNLATLAPAPLQLEPLNLRLAKAIETLELDERIVLYLFFYEEVEVDDIGVALGISERKVRRILKKTMKELTSKVSGEPMSLYMLTLV